MTNQLPSHELKDTTTQPIERTNGSVQTIQPLANSTPKRPRVVVVGAGFGGLNAVRALGNSDVDVLLIDRNNYHGFWPLLYQVATAGLEAESITYPVRAILRNYENCAFRMAEVRGIDMEQKIIHTDGAPEPYDYAILAAGSVNNYFGNKSLEENTFGMKDVDEAANVRNQVLLSFERATTESDPAKRAALMTFVIIGGGPTGVELSGAFMELIRHVMGKDYPMLDVGEARVVLVEADESVLGTFPPRLQRAALKRLKRMGVTLMLGRHVSEVNGDKVLFQEGGQIEAHTVIWAAGVRSSDLSKALGVEQGRQGRVKVSPELYVPKHPDVFIVGDMAYLEGYQPGVAYPMVAQVAIQMGKQAAKNILANVHNQPMKPFKYFDFGSMATIGRSAAVFDAFGIRLTGIIAWFGWLFVHILYLIGFRNRVVVLANWIVNYFTYERGVRVITQAPTHTPEKITVEREGLEPATQRATTTSENPSSAQPTAVA